MHVELVDHTIDVQAVLALGGTPESGAVSLFLGRVRNHHQGHAVDYLEYEAYPAMALDSMRAIAKQAAERWNLSHLSVVHRLGRLQVGDVSVLVAACSEHRAEAFEACRFVIDTLKSEVPIWKREVGPDHQVWIEGTDLRPSI